MVISKCSGASEVEVPVTKIAKRSKQFWDKVDLDHKYACWEWIGGKCFGGYGQFRFQASGNTAHRFSWFIHFGVIPKGLCVLHRCDNRSCVNPFHLYIGSHKENTQDAIRRKRALIGEKNGSSKLTEKEVLQIRQEYDEMTIKNQSALARKYSVSNSTIHAVIKRTQWKHI